MGFDVRRFWNMCCLLRAFLVTYFVWCVQQFFFGIRQKLWVYTWPNRITLMGVLEVTTSMEANIIVTEFVHMGGGDTLANKL